MLNLTGRLQTSRDFDFSWRSEGYVCRGVGPPIGDRGGTIGLAARDCGEQE